MLWKDVIEFYGKESAEKMKGSRQIINIRLLDLNKKEIDDDILTADLVDLFDKGEIIYDFDEKEIENAYREVTGLKVHKSD